MFRKIKLLRIFVTILALLEVWVPSVDQVIIRYVFLHSSSSSNSSSKSDPVDMASNSLINTFPRAPGTSDSVRIKCRNLLTAALQTGGKTCFCGL